MWRLVDTNEEGLAGSPCEAGRGRGGAQQGVARHAVPRVRTRLPADFGSREGVEIGQGTRVGRSDDRRRPIFTPSNPSTVTLLAATAPDLFVEALIRTCDATARRAGKRVLNPTERERQLSELDPEILALQRAEEAVITSIAASDIYAVAARCRSARSADGRGASVFRSGGSRGGGCNFGRNCGGRGTSRRLGFSPSARDPLTSEITPEHEGLHLPRDHAGRRARSRGF